MKMWEIKDLDFTDPELGKVRVVIVEEEWTETQVRGGQRVQVQMRSHWRWLVSRKLETCPAKSIWQIGHRRWGIENHAFNELTQYYSLEHCARHEPVANLIWLLIRILGFMLFEVYTKVHCKGVRLGQQTLTDVCDELWQALGRWEELEALWSG